MSMLKSRLPLFVSTAMVLLCSSPALAQADDGDAQDDSTTSAVAANDGGIQDIVVTARRREESQQSTPITLLAFSGEELVTKGILNPVDLMRITPGIRFDEFPPGNVRPGIRAVGGGEVSFIDGLWASANQMLSIDMYDLERVEVLKGPQGTLYGRNAISGAINFITNKPVHVFEGSARLTLGEFGQKNGHLMVNAPLTDSLSARVVISAITNTGFRETEDGKPIDDVNKKSARAHLLYDVSEDTSLLLSADYVFIDNSDQSRYNVALFPFVPGKGQADFDKPRITENHDVEGHNRTKTGGLRAELSTDALEFANLTVLTGWRTSDYDLLGDHDGSNVADNQAHGIPRIWQTVEQFNRTDSYSFESRLSSLHEGPLSWVAGLYFNRSDSYNEYEVTRVTNAATLPNPPHTGRSIREQEHNTYAVFGEAEFEVFDGFSLIAGGRYTKEDKTAGYRRLTGNRGNPTIPFDNLDDPTRYEGERVTYRFGANWQVTDNVFLFGSYSTGFGSPGFPSEPANLYAATHIGPEEKGKNYEIGIKTDLFDRRARANVSLFRLDYYDFGTGKLIPDLSQGPDGTRRVEDPATAKIQGIESEFVLAPVDWFDATVRYTYLDAMITKLIQTSSINADGTPNFTDGAGNRLSRTPEHALSIDVGVQTDESASWGWLRADVSMDYQSDIFDNNVNDYVAYRRARTLWSGGVTYHINDDYSVRLWGTNLTDVEYRIWQSDGPGYNYVNYGAPRQFGVTLDAKFR